MRYLVLKIDNDPSDTHATEIRDASYGRDADRDASYPATRCMDLAMADKGSRMSWGVVVASDAGAARIMRPTRWYTTAQDACCPPGLVGVTC